LFQKGGSLKEAVEELLAVSGSLVQALEHICKSTSAHWGLVPLIASAKGRLRVARFMLNRTDLPPDCPPSNQPPPKPKRRS
jgi:hypothetical protein